MMCLMLHHAVSSSLVLLSVVKVLRVSLGAFGGAKMLLLLRSGSVLMFGDKIRISH